MVTARSLLHCGEGKPMLRLAVAGGDMVQEKGAAAAAPRGLKIEVTLEHGTYGTAADAGPSE